MTPLNNVKFLIGDIVFAKVKGYPHWPAKIHDIEGKDTKLPKYNVTFFGTNDTSKVKQTDLCSYLENKGKYGQPKTQNYRNNKFNIAIKEADNCYKNSPTVKRRSFNKSVDIQTPSSTPKPTQSADDMSPSCIKTPSGDKPKLAISTHTNNNNSINGKLNEDYPITKTPSVIDELLSSSWLSDNTIWQYLDLINDKLLKQNNIVCVNPTICQAVKMLDDFHFILEPMNLDKVKYIVLPINDCIETNYPDNTGGSHWSLLIFENTSNRFYHYDSIQGHNKDSAKVISNKVLSFITGSVGLMAVVEERQTPQQQNSYDCGVLLIIMAELIIHKLLSSDDTITSLLNYTFMPQISEFDLITKRSQIAYAINNRLTTKPDLLQALFIKCDNIILTTNQQTIETCQTVTEDYNSEKNDFISPKRLTKKTKISPPKKDCFHNPLQQQYHVDVSNKYNLLLTIPKNESLEIIDNQKPLYKINNTEQHKSHSTGKSKTSKTQNSSNYQWVNPCCTKQSSKINKTNKINIKQSLLIGDSIIKYVMPENCQVNTYPGIYVDQLKNKITIMDNKERSLFKTVIIHVGTNDLSKCRSPDDVMGRMYNLILLAKTLFPKANIVINSIVKRRDISLKLVKITNRNIKWICRELKVVFFELNKYIDTRCLGRDGLHLNRRGSYYLEKIIDNINKICNKRMGSIVDHAVRVIQGSKLRNMTEDKAKNTQRTCLTEQKMLTQSDEHIVTRLAPTAKNPKDNISIPTVSMDEFPPLSSQSSHWFGYNETGSSSNYYDSIHVDSQIYVNNSYNSDLIHSPAYAPKLYDANNVSVVSTPHLNSNVKAKNLNT